MKPDLRRPALLLALALAGCGGSDDNARATAPGEVLPGSASDAMLPLDTLRSQPPLAPEAAASGTARQPKARTAGAAEPAGAASEPAPDAPASDTPAAAEPAPE